ncbi:hypothetical protein HZH66_011764 [Vespula vulgaris]|uniref:Uncharacterized protein n=1 Tax=Vespula vulgaris TaxID=7454 RepID=A0A834MUK8_VESVU|nr:hypothetical protein HZH66_011764 [Vespula vulgaris]
MDKKRETEKGGASCKRVSRVGGDKDERREEEEEEEEEGEEEEEEEAKEREEEKVAGMEAYGQFAWKLRHYRRGPPESNHSSNGPVCRHLGGRLDLPLLLSNSLHSDSRRSLIRRGSSDYAEVSTRQIGPFLRRNRGGGNVQKIMRH